MVAHTVVTESGCWEWTAAVGKRRHREYPRINVWNPKTKTRESKRPHRVMFEEYYDVDLSPEIDVDHKCLNIRCICPWHLESTTRRENILRRHGKGTGEKVELPKRSAAIEASIDHWFRHGGVAYPPSEIPF
jgi:hypothetical protein